MVEQKQILIGVAIFFIFLALYMLGKNVSENLTVPKNAKATGQVACSVKTCGTTGTHYRDVGCFDPTGKVRVADSVCTDPKPLASDSCSTPACLPWTSGNWDQSCPACGPTNVTQTRPVTCSGPDQLNDCDQNLKPNTTQSCNNPICTAWVQPVFPPCPSCGPNPTISDWAATTNAYCPPGKTCDPSKQPSNTMVCSNIKACGSWSAPVFDNCPSCGPDPTVTLNAKTPSVCPTGVVCSDPMPPQQKTCSGVLPCGTWSAPTFDPCPVCGPNSSVQLTAKTQSVCPTGTYCDPTLQPSNTQTCNNIPSCQWRYGAWADSQSNIVPL